VYNNRTALERAFDLAKSGACSSISDLRRCLVLEGYSPNQIIGRTLLKQLRVLMSETQDPEVVLSSKKQSRNHKKSSDADAG
jgi:hypothetical protein